MASLAPLCGTLRRAVLQHMRMAPAAATCPVPTAAAALLMGPARSFAEAAGTYLDRNEVTERVLNIVKNFQKVDPSKVRSELSFVPPRKGLLLEFQEAGFSRSQEF